jgi:ABC-type dipeptide/oligopeptide/nickel transport system permease component
MVRYLVRRLLSALIVLLGVTLIVFALLRLTPGDPAELVLGDTAEITPQDIARVRARLGLDKSLVTQYGIFVWDLIHGDLGTSVYSREPVAQVIASKMGNTLLLTGSALALSVLIAVPVGVVSAAKPYTLFDGASMVLALSGTAIPSFWLGLMLILLFGVKLKWLPPSGAGTWRHLILPTLTLGLGRAALLARLIRASLLEAVSQDYVRTARAKGLGERAILLRHALRNALIPVVTVLGLQIAFLLSGAVLTETVFAWPGLGRAMVRAVLKRDYPVVQGIALLISASVVLTNLLIDSCYGLLNPTIRRE